MTQTQIEEAVSQWTRNVTAQDAMKVSIINSIPGVKPEYVTVTFGVRLARVLKTSTQRSSVRLLQATNFPEQDLFTFIHEFYVEYKIDMPESEFEDLPQAASQAIQSTTSEDFAVPQLIAKDLVQRSTGVTDLVATYKVKQAVVEMKDVATSTRPAHLYPPESAAASASAVALATLGVLLFCLVGTAILYCHNKVSTERGIAYEDDRPSCCQFWERQRAKPEQSLPEIPDSTDDRRDAEGERDQVVQEVMLDVTPSHEHGLCADNLWKDDSIPDEPGANSPSSADVGDDGSNSIQDDVPCEGEMLEEMFPLALQQNGDRFTLEVLSRVDVARV